MSGIIVFTFACKVPACASLSMVDEAAYQYDSMTVLFRATISISGYGQQQLRVLRWSSTLHRRLIASYTTSISSTAGVRFYKNGLNFRKSLESTFNSDCPV